MANNPPNNNSQSSLEIKNLTIENGSQQFADKITNQNKDINTGSYIEGNIVNISHIYNSPPDNHSKMDAQRIYSSIQLTKETIERINKYFYGYFELFQILDEFPKLKNKGIYKPTYWIKRLATKYETQLKNNKRPNDPHGLLDSETNCFDKPLTLLYKSTDFATICALREKKEKPRIISAGVIAINEENRQLFLHRRAKECATYPNALHIIGGGFEPPGIKPKNDGSNLKNTMRREFLEELEIGFDYPKNTKLLFGVETDTGFIQIVALGVKVNSHDYEDIKDNWEGNHIKLGFDELYEKLSSDKENWVPSGKAHILVWLALGAPNCHPETKFSGYSAQELFEKAISN